jgi:cleavage and polyadenylation specificity factor subunit 1
MSAFLHQRVEDVWQSLALFFRNLSLAQQKYSAYNREILAIYEAASYFRHMVEARHLPILTEHKPLTFAFHQERDKCSQRQFQDPDLISQFTIDILHISGQDNIVTYALSRFEVITAPLTHEALAAAQADDYEWRTLLVNTTTIQLKNPHRWHLNRAVQRHFRWQTESIRPVSPPPSGIQLPAFSQPPRNLGDS